MADVGLAKVKTLTNDRLFRAKALKQEGRKIIGYTCCYAPLELFTALDIIPIRIFGDPAEVPNQADAHTEHSMCSFARSCFDLALKGRYDCLDGFVMPHACDISEKMFEHWSYFKPEMFAYYVMVPHTDRSSSVEQYYAELRRMKTAMEKFAGMEISGDKLVEAVKMHNENRALLRELYSYRKTEIPLISGTDIKQVILACTCLPVQEANELLREVITEVSVQTNGREKILPRIMVYGTPMNSDFIDLIEECGADVVIDDLCVGTRFFWHDVKSTDDPLAGLADRYLTKIKCPRLYRKMPGEYNYEADMEYRFGYLKEFAREWKADGIVSYILRYCDSHQFEIPDIRDYLKKSNYPLLILDGDYKIASEQLKTRIQAFLEMIEYQKGGMSNE